VTGIHFAGLTQTAHRWQRAEHRLASEVGELSQEQSEMPLPLSKALALRANGIPRSLKEFEQSLRLLGVLRPLGFQNSARRGMSLDGDGNAVPWWSYAANEWVEARIRPTDRVFEYGSGGSTIWLAARARSVVSVEHDNAWYQKIRSSVPSNARVIYEPARSEVSSDIHSSYSSAILANEPPFDIIIIDGMERNACAMLAPQVLSAEGIIVFDNSHRTKYRAGMESLAEAGLWRIDFAGCVTDLSVTSVFTRSVERWLDASALPRDVGT
jgi:hypothetical protein